jgi:hypothetical protein
MSFKATLDKAKAVKRLFERQVDRTDPKLDHDARKRRAAALMDDEAGPEWRDVAAAPGVMVIETGVLSAPPARGPAPEATAHDGAQAFLDRVRDALAATGDHPERTPDADDCPPPVKQARNLGRLAADPGAVLILMGTAPGCDPGCECEVCDAD